MRASHGGGAAAEMPRAARSSVLSTPGAMQRHYSLSHTLHCTAHPAVLFAGSHPMEHQGAAPGATPAAAAAPASALASPSTASEVSAAPSIDTKYLGGNILQMYCSGSRLSNSEVYRLQLMFPPGSKGRSGWHLAWHQLPHKALPGDNIRSAVQRKLG